MSKKQSWEDLPDIVPAKKQSWEDLPDIDEDAPVQRRVVRAGGSSPEWANSTAVEDRDRPAIARYFDEKLPAVKKVGEWLTPVGAGVGAAVGADKIAGALGAVQELVSGPVEALKQRGEARPTLQQLEEQEKLHPSSDEPLEARLARVHRLYRLREAKPENESGLGRSYREARDQYRAGEDRDREAGPLRFGVGQVAGSVALPGPRLGAAKSVAGKAGLAATEGLLSATGQTLLTSRAQGEDLEKELLVSGGAGAVLPAAVTAGGHKASQLVSKMVGGAETRAVKAAGGIQKDLKKLALRDPEEIVRVGRELLEETTPSGERLISANPLANSKEKIASRVGARLKDLGTAIGRAVDAHPNPNVARDALLDAIEAEAREHAKSPAAKGYVSALRAEKEAIGELMDELLSARTLHDEKVAQQALVNYEKANPSTAGAAKAREFIANLFKQAEEGAVWLGGGDDQLTAFKTLKQKFGRLSRPAQWAREAVAREQGNNFIPLTGYMMGSDLLGAGAAGGLPAAAATMYGRKLVGEYGDAALARMLYQDAGARELQRGAQKMTPAASRRLLEYFRGEDEQDD